MKKLLLGVLAGFFLGCSYDYSLTQPIGSFTVVGDPSQPALPEGVISEIAVDPSALPDVNLDLTRSITVDQLTLEVEAGDFDFISEARVYARVADDSLPRVLIAEGTPVLNEGVFTLPGLPGVDLRDYLPANMSIEVEMTGTTPEADALITGQVDILIEIL